MANVDLVTFNGATSSAEVTHISSAKTRAVVEPTKAANSGKDKPSKLLPAGSQIVVPTAKGSTTDDFSAYIEELEENLGRNISLSASDTANLMNVLQQLKDKIKGMTPEERAQLSKDLDTVNGALTQLAKDMQAGNKTAVAADLTNVKNAKDAVTKDTKTNQDSGSQTSIWWVLTNFWVNDLMGQNQLEMMSYVAQVGAQSQITQSMASHLADLDKKIQEQEQENHADPMKLAFVLIGCVIGGALLGAVTGGLGLIGAIGALTATTTGVLAGVLVGGVAGGTVMAVGFTHPNSPGMDKLSNQGADPDEQADNQAKQQLYNLIGGNATQNISTANQIGVNAMTQLNQQEAQAFSTIVQYQDQTNRVAS